MKEKVKLKLEDIKVESFVTALNETNRIVGATDEGEVCGRTQYDPTCGTSPGACCNTDYCPGYTDLCS